MTESLNNSGPDQPNEEPKNLGGFSDKGKEFNDRISKAAEGLNERIGKSLRPLFRSPAEIKQDLETALIKREADRINRAPAQKAKKEALQAKKEEYKLKKAELREAKKEQERVRREGRKAQLEARKVGTGGVEKVKFEPTNEFPLDDPDKLREFAAAKLTRFRRVSEGLEAMDEGAEGRRELIKERDNLYAWFKTALDLGSQEAKSYQWHRPLMDHWSQNQPGWGKYFEDNLFNPIIEEIKNERQKAIDWMVKEIAERGITVQGIGADRTKDANASDIDGNMSIRLLIEAGFVIPGQTKINYVRHDEFEEGKGADGAFIIDIGKGDFDVSSMIKHDISRGLSSKKSQGNGLVQRILRLIRKRRTIDSTKASVVLDHHGPESTPTSGSASYRVYRLMVALGRIEPTERLEQMIASVDGLDDKLYLQPGYNYDSHSLAGLQRVLIPGGKRPLQFINSNTKEFSPMFRDLLIASGGDPAKHLDDDVLQRIGLLEKAREMDAKEVRARAKIAQLKTEGKVIRALADGSYVAFDTDKKIFGQEIFNQLSIPDLLYDEGILTIVNQTSGRKEGTTKSMFVNPQNNFGAINELSKRYGGDVVRRKMWILANPDGPLPSQAEIMGLLDTPAQREITYTSKKESKKHAGSAIERVFGANIDKVVVKTYGPNSELYREAYAIAQQRYPALGGLEKAYAKAWDSTAKQLVREAVLRAGDSAENSGISWDKVSEIAKSKKLPTSESSQTYKEIKQKLFELGADTLKAKQARDEVYEHQDKRVVATEQEDLPKYEAYIKELLDHRENLKKPAKLSPWAVSVIRVISFGKSLNVADWFDTKVLNPLANDGYNNALERAGSHALKKSEAKAVDAENTEKIKALEEARDKLMIASGVGEIVDSSRPGNPVVLKEGFQLFAHAYSGIPGLQEMYIAEKDNYVAFGKEMSLKELGEWVLMSHSWKISETGVRQLMREYDPANPNKGGLASRFLADQVMAQLRNQYLWTDLAKQGIRISETALRERAVAVAKNLKKEIVERQQKRDGRGGARVA